MIDYIFLTGLFGALILVVGAAWPEGKDLKRPMKSVKNWLFAIGAVTMLIYALLNYYFTGGAVFFAFLQGFIVIASVMMMLNLSDKVDIPIISLTGIGFVIWSLTLFEGYTTIIFILGLVGISLGYTLQMGTLKRSTALMLGGALIAIFSYIEANWIFFWLNVFFAVFSGYYVMRMVLLKGYK
ncbi:hypothetical protein KJ742_00765 [Patescibacteria group bacterium]|nr:hypothetical protein [Patescibacteria group bacterium]MBU1682454.1 hypothetical protein [Patescibacteria group bacterium]MBU1935567.1 hypothetical protein [Patescibacteria group bacterium]